MNINNFCRPTTNFAEMSAFSTPRRDFGNGDVVRHISFFVNQRDKIVMATSTKVMYEALQEMMPTSTKYVTTVKPNLMSIFSSANNVYSAPISIFDISKYRNFSNFHQSMITHVGANEDKDYYAAWYECHLKLGKGLARNIRKEIDLYMSDLSARDEEFLIERFLDSVDTRLFDHNCLQYTPDIMNGIAKNTSIVEMFAYSEETSCRCNLFSCISLRSTDIIKLYLVGGICVDSTQMIADFCVKGLKQLSIATCNSFSEIHGFTVDVICDAVADCGILEVLEIGNVTSGYEEWADGLIRTLEICPIISLRINETEFDENCLEGMVRVLSGLKATDVKMTCCDFDDWGKPVFDALFSNTSTCWLDLSYTTTGDESVGYLVEMIRRGKLTRLAIGGCGVGRDGIKIVMQATTHANSKLVFISIFKNDIDHPVIFDELDGTSLECIHVGELGNARALAAKLVLIKSRTGKMCDIDARDSDHCFNEGGGVWPWMTQSQSHEF